jgi:hypothetical protein
MITKIASLKKNSLKGYLLIGRIVYCQVAKIKIKLIYSYTIPD